MTIRKSMVVSTSGLVFGTSTLNLSPEIDQQKVSQFYLLLMVWEYGQTLGALIMSIWSNEVATSQKHRFPPKGSLLVLGNPQKKSGKSFGSGKSPYINLNLGWWNIIPFGHVIISHKLTAVFSSSHVGARVATTQLTHQDLNPQTAPAMPD